MPTSFSPEQKCDELDSSFFARSCNRFAPNQWAIASNRSRSHKPTTHLAFQNLPFRRPCVRPLPFQNHRIHAVRAQSAGPGNPQRRAAPRRASRPSFPPLQATPLSPTDIRALLHLTPHVTEYAVPTQSPPLLYKEMDHLPYRLAHPKLTPHHRRPPISSSSRSIRPFQSTVSLPRRRSCCRLPSLDLSPWGSGLESDHPPGLLQGLRWRPRGASAPSGRRI